MNEFIEQLNSNDYSSLIDNKKFLLRFFRGIKFSIPDEINKPEIKSRLTVIETDFMRFEDNLGNYTSTDMGFSDQIVEPVSSNVGEFPFPLTFSLSLIHI